MTLTELLLAPASVNLMVKVRVLMAVAAPLSQLRLAQLQVSSDLVAQEETTSHAAHTNKQYEQVVIMQWPSKQASFCRL